MGLLQLTVTRYKIHRAGEQATHWDIQEKKNQIWLDEVAFLECPSAQLALQHGPGFCAMWPYRNSFYTFHRVVRRHNRSGYSNSVYKIGLK